MLKPLAVIPVVVPDGTADDLPRGELPAGRCDDGAVDVAAGLVAVGGQLAGLGRERGTWVTHSGIVDEGAPSSPGHRARASALRRTTSTTHGCAVLVAIANTPDGALLYRRATTTSGTWCRPSRRRTPSGHRTTSGPHTVFFTNMGTSMLGMNVGLDIRDHRPDRADPAASRCTPSGSRTAGSGTIRTCSRIGPSPRGRSSEPPVPADYLDENWVIEAQAALKCPATESMLSAIRGPMGPRRFLSNVMHAADFTAIASTGCPRSNWPAAVCRPRRSRATSTPGCRRPDRSPGGPVVWNQRARGAPKYWRGD